MSTATTARQPAAQQQGNQQLAAPREEKHDIRSILQAPATVKRFQQIAPRHLNPERLLRTMALAVHKTPKLAECDPMTLLGAMMVCGSLGLEPNTPLGHAYLIPFEKRTKRGEQWVTERVDVNLIIGYRGYIDLARRSGELVSIHADVVYDGDDFSFEYGSNMHLRHVPRGKREGRAPQWAYAHAKLRDGEAFEVLPYEEVLAIRDNSEGYKSALRNKGRNQRAFDSSPWVAYEHEMAAKTLIRRISKMLPLSMEFANAAQLDAMSDAGKVDFGTFAKDDEAITFVDKAWVEQGNGQVIEAEEENAEPAPIQAPGKKPAAAAKQQQPAADQQQTPPHDPETGEVFDEQNPPPDSEFEFGAS